NLLDANVVNEKMKETIATLIIKYESYLDENHLYDFPQLLFLIRKDESLFEQVKQEAKECQISIYPNEELSKLETRLMEDLGFHQLKEMTEARKEAPKITSLKSYGFANGVDHLLQTVVNKELPMDELCIVYTDSSQLPTIQQAIERSGLAATYAEGIPLSH